MAGLLPDPHPSRMPRSCAPPRSLRPLPRRNWLPIRRFAGMRAPLALRLLAFVAALAPRAVAAEPVKVLVAVLPFQVHSGRSLEGLEESLADLLATRLEASGEVRVLDAVVVRQGLVAHVAGERTDEVLRRIASELGADWVVEGSLTELAGRFSLDVRVTPVGTRIPTRTMVLTAAGEEELLERVNELADQVLRIVGRRESDVIVAEVRLVGAETLDPALRTRLATRPQRVYAADQLGADLDALRASPGVQDARAEVARGPAGVVVTFHVTPMPGAQVERAMPPPAVPGEQVAEVRIRGNRRIEADAIRARLATRAEAPYLPAQIVRDVREIHAMGFFRDVRVLTEASEAGRVVIFEVEESPVVRQITITGNDALDSSRIRDELTLTTGSTLDHPLLFENRERIQALYRAQGYYLARVGYTIEPLAGEAVAIHFEVTEGKKLRLRRIGFLGNEHFSDEELREGLKTKPWRFYSHVTRFLDNSGTYAEPVFLQDLQTVERKYLDAGLLQVELEEPRVEADQDGLVVSVRVREGRRFRVGALDVRGDPTVDLDALREELSLVEGEWFNRSYLTQDVETLTRRYTDRGFYFASVNPVTNLSEEELTVDVNFEVEKGPLYFVREIEIAGNTRTVDPVIRREMQLVEGQLYSARALQVSQGRIRGLGFFEEVNFEPKPTDLPDQLDVDVKVVERPTGSLSFGAGFSSQDRLVLTGSVAQANLFGRGYGLQASVDTGGRSDRFYLSFSNPYWLGTSFSLATTLFRTSIRFEDFEQEQEGVDLTLGHALDEENRSRGFWRYSWANREIDEDTRVNAASLILRQILSGAQSTSLTALSFRTDTRDDRVLPTEGYQLAGSLEFAGLGGFAEFLRLEGRAYWYRKVPELRWLPLPFEDRSTVMLAARFGWSLPFNDIADYDLPERGPLTCVSEQACPIDLIDDDLELPLTERYFLGGLGTFQLRGFRARSVGPRRPILYNTTFGGALGLDSRGPYAPLGRDQAGVCKDTALEQGNNDGICNDLDDEDTDDFEDLEQTDVIGGNKFVSMTAEYRFPISEALGLVGIFFLDTGNAFDENQNVFDVGKWRFGTGAGVLWFSPFGPIQAFWGVPLDPLEDVEDASVFEFSVGGAGF